MYNLTVLDNYFFDQLEETYIECKKYIDRIIDGEKLEHHPFTTEHYDEIIIEYYFMKKRERKINKLWKKNT